MICSAIYPTIIQFLSFVRLIIWIFISVNGLASVFDCLLAAASCLLSALTAISLISFNFFLAILFRPLLVSTALSAIAFNFLLAKVSGISPFHSY